MSSICPVLRRFPATRQCLEDSNIPLSVTVTPLTHDDEVIVHPPNSLTGIPKCWQCGAPHACPSTHVRSGVILVCYLCGTSCTLPPRSDDPPHDRDAPPPIGKTHQFALPLRLPHTNGTSGTVASPLYAVPATSCPVIWMIVLDGGCHHATYWNSVADTLQHCLSTAPPYVHVALLIASQPDTSSADANASDSPCTLGVFDLQSPVPHIRRYRSSRYDRDEDQLLLLDTVLGAAVPADTPHIATAVRSLMDYHPPRRYDAPDRCPVAWLTELVLATLAHGAVPAGQRGVIQPPFSVETDTESLPLLPYAGVTLTFFLADRPAGLSSTSKTWPRSTGPAAGYRFGGSTMGSNGHGSSPSRDESGGPDSPHRSPLPHAATETELTPTRLFERYQPVDGIEAYYADLGRQCADAAVGVDILLLVTNNSNGRDGDDSVPDFGLALFHPLAERSGADVPLLVDLIHETPMQTPTTTESPLARFQRSVAARTPWQAGRVFGAELRLRASPGFAVDPTVIAPLPGVTGPQLAPLYYEAGLVGPASRVVESAQLWRMGTACSNTAYTMDLELTQPRVPDRTHVEGVGDVPLKPVIQTCFAYTAIEADTNETTGVVSYQTVRRMRITSRPVPLAHSVEALYASLDTEALAVVLFHKIALASVQDGLVEAADMAGQWLQLLLACVYRSAQDQFEVERRNMEKGVTANKNDAVHRYFYPSERLLNLDGELSTDDVLLAQGHDRLRPVALMVYLLLQSDPLRLGEGGQYYRPSFDERLVTLAQMTCMTPSTLTRCIAPRLQLWESGADVKEPIFEVLDLKSEAVQSAVLESSSLSSKKGAPGLILLLDTPDEIVVMDARYVNTDFNSATSNGSPKRGGKASPLIVGQGLQQAILDAANSYRTRPRIIYELDQSETSGERTLLRLLDCLLEDTPNVALGCEHFADWKANIACAVQKDVDDPSAQ